MNTFEWIGASGAVAAPILSLPLCHWYQTVTPFLVGIVAACIFMLVFAAGRMLRQRP
jgi:hypothetical protein